jgi:glycosyltransferase involved in cell wall biosynthesis
MKVLIVSNMYPGRDPDYDYKGVFVKEQVDWLRKTPEIDVDVFIIDGHKGFFEYFSRSLVLLYKVLFGNYNVIHCHYGISAMFTLFIPFKRWGNVVLTLHGGDILVKQGKYFQVALTKRILKKVGRVITLNDEMNIIVSNITKKFDTLVCGVDSELFDGRFIKKNHTQILFPGRTDREVKNYPFFSEIVNAYNNAGKLCDVVVLDGFSRKEMANIMQRSSLLLMTSHSEGSPQVIKEALLSDLPVLSSNVGDVINVIGNTQGTMVYGDLTAEQIASNIDRLINEAALTPGQRRNRIFSLELDQKSVIKKLINVYKDIIRVTR